MNRARPGSESGNLRQLSAELPVGCQGKAHSVKASERRSAMGPDCSFGIRGWRFSLVLHGSRVQLEAHHKGEIISCWLTPNESINEAAHQLLARPMCCLMA
jgi:hypothetical protein